MGMALRCFLFSSDEGTSDLIRQVMTGLGVEGEFCGQATTAVEKLAHELFQIVVIDWDQQPQAAMLLSAARERKPAERPLTIAIVGDDAGVPKALQAGANSILRKPLLANQVTDTLTTARDLLRSRQESAASAAAASAGASSAATPLRIGTATLRAGEFLQSAPVRPGGQFETDADPSQFPQDSAAEGTDPLADLEPVAASVPERRPSPPPPPPSDEPRGLEWHLKARGIVRHAGPVMEAPPRPPENSKPELLGYDQSPSPSVAPEASAPQPPAPPQSRESAAQEQKEEAKLFSYISGEDAEPAERSPSGFRIGKGAIIAALLLAACAIAAAPQAPWHAKFVVIAGRGQRALHGWLNPQPVTAVAPTPTSHEDFGRAGDEYKLPVAENIPDATTDPSQISVLPVVDPTAKKPPADAAATEQPVATPDASTSPADGNPPSPAPA